MQMCLCFVECELAKLRRRINRISFRSKMFGLSKLLPQPTNFFAKSKINNFLHFFVTYGEAGWTRLTQIMDLNKDKWAAY